MLMDETTSREDLEMAAIEAYLDLNKVAAASDAELLQMLRDWIEAGDECVQ